MARLTDADVARFMAYHEGHTSGYMRFFETSKKDSDDPKQNAHGTKTIYEEPVKALWRQHLLGEIHLSIGPVNINEMCRWGAVDIDDYTGMDHAKLAYTAVMAGWTPVIVTRSKSGGAHIRIYCSEWVPAALMQSAMRKMTADLGLVGKAEIFPKQIKWRTKGGKIEDRQIGACLNLPYQNADRTERFEISVHNTQSTFSEFLDHIEQKQVSAEDLRNLPHDKKTNRSFAEDFDGAPPCLMKLATDGFPVHTRNGGLFNLATYLKKRYPDTWISVLDQYHSTYFKHGNLLKEEVADIKRYHRRDSGNHIRYQCQDILKPFCNAQLCRTKKYGVGDTTSNGIFIESIEFEKTEPTRYHVTMTNGQIIKNLVSGQLNNHLKFSEECLNQLLAIYGPQSQKEHRMLLIPIMPKASEIPIADDVKPGASFKELVTDFFKPSRSTDSGEAMLAQQDQKHYRHTNRDDDIELAFTLKGIVKYLRTHEWEEDRILILGRLKEYFGADLKTYRLPEAKKLWYIKESKIDLSEPIAAPPQLQEVRI